LTSGPQGLLVNVNTTPSVIRLDGIAVILDHNNIKTAQGLADVPANFEAGRCYQEEAAEAMVTITQDRQTLSGEQGNE